MMILKEPGLRTDAELALVRMGQDGRADRVALARGASLEIGGLKIKTDRTVDFLEVALDGGRTRVIGGPAPAGLTLTLDGKKVRFQD